MKHESSKLHINALKYKKNHNQTDKNYNRINKMQLKMIKTIQSDKNYSRINKMQLDMINTISPVLEAASKHTKKSSSKDKRK